MESAVDSKLLEARSAAHRMADATRTMADRRADFFAALGAIRSAYERIPHEAIGRASGRKNAADLKRRFRDWWTSQEARANADELVRWVFDARNDDHHIPRNGDPLVTAGSWGYDSITIDYVPSGEAVAIDANGDVVRIIDPDTDREVRLPMAFPQRRDSSIHWALKEPPLTHMGTLVTDRSPSAVLLLAAEYVRQLAVASRDLYT